MNIKKSKKFENAYVIKGMEIITEHSEAIYQDFTRHYFIKDSEEKNGEVIVPYVFFSRHYQKWYEDVAYVSKTIFNSIISRLN